MVWGEAAIFSNHTNDFIFSGLSSNPSLSVLYVLIAHAVHMDRTDFIRHRSLSHIQGYIDRYTGYSEKKIAVNSTGKKHALTEDGPWENNSSLWAPTTICIVL